MEVQDVASTNDIQKDQSIQAVSANQPANADDTAKGDFASLVMKAIEGSSNPQFNEEELFSMIVGKKCEEVSPEAGSKFQAEMSKLSSSMARPSDGYVQVEDVTIAALKNLVADGTLDEDTAKKINGEAFAAAQLDSNTSALYDSRGSEGDPTIAVASKEEALSKLKDALAKLASGELGADPKELEAGGGALGASAASAGSGAQQLDGSGGFLWKPVSESDGNLVVLLPTSLKDLVKNVEIHSELPPLESTKLGEGRFSGNKNGDRPHFRFDKEGGEYGDNVYVVAHLNSGETQTWQIGNGSERND